MKGKKGKGNGCQSEVMPLLCLLLWQAELSSLNEFVVCSEQATSFIENSQNTTPHLIPMPYESWSSPKDCLFPSETGILNWIGGVFFLGICLGEQVGQAMSTDTCTLAMCWPSSRQESKLSSSLIQLLLLEVWWCHWWQHFAHWDKILGHSYALCSSAELWWKGLEAG